MSLSLHSSKTNVHSKDLFDFIDIPKIRGKKKKKKKTFHYAIIILFL